VRVLLVVPMVPQAEGAGAIPELLHAELAGLLEDHDVTVLGTYGDLAGQAESADDLARAGLDVHFVDRRRSRSPARRWRVRLELATRWARGGWPWRTVSTVGGLQPVLDRLAATREFDVVAVEDSAMSALRLPSGVPAVLTEHEALRAPAEDWWDGRLSERPLRGFRALDRRRWESYQLAAWKRADLLQVFTASDAAAIESRAPAVSPRIRVNPFGLVLPSASDRALEAPSTLLFSGTFTHPPNRDAAIWLAREIMPAIVSANPGARLRIVGTAPPREVLALAGANVEVIADAPSVRPHMEAAAVVVAPVRGGGGMRMKVLQAFAAGKPVVTTRLGAEGFDVLDPSPPLVIGDTAEAIAAAVEGLLADAGRRRELGRQAREFAERYHSPAAWAARLGAIYEEASTARR
jgi:polysaccharide biosynthesis protein PslH